jgi:peroxiredoxin
MPNRTPVRIATVVACLALTVAGASCSNFRSAIRNVHNKDMVGQLAPELVGATWIGATEAVPAAARFNDWTVIAFFRPWDSACAEDVPRLADLQRSYHHRGLRVLGVTEAPEDRAREFMADHSVPYPVLCGAQASEDAFGVELLWGGEVFLVDPGGIVVADKLPNVERLLREELGEPFSRR